ncbi:MAG TPA: polysaccharide deacetylase family protein, partial [Acidimicrobiales bacterium]|nr:polysaccharide deacetylase family protein [Acidimicrobiales bacterium]
MGARGGDRRPARRSARWWLALATAVLGAVGVAALAVPLAQRSVRVTVDGASVEVSGSSPTVQAALAAAGRVPHDGALRSAAGGAVLEPHAHPAAVAVDGHRATLSRRLRAGARVVVVDGEDSVEATEVRQAEVPPPPLPAVESLLWYPGAPGVDEQTVGTVSHEVVSAKRLVEPVPPRREEGQVVALTFDDGPSPTWTPQVLQILAEEGVHATFCLVGDMVRKRPEVTRTIAGHGHTLCSHTMNHPPDLGALPHEQAAQELVAGTDEVAAVTGQPVPLFRAPAGRTTPDIIDLAHARGMRVLDWTVDAEASQHRSAEELLGRVQAHLKPGAVILLHDGGGVRDTTVAMLRPLIQSLKAAGWQFATPTAPPPPP